MKPASKNPKSGDTSVIWIAGLAFLYWFVLIAINPLGFLLVGHALPFSRLLWPLFLSAVLLIQALRKKKLNWPRPGKWIRIYFIWAGLTVLWTTGPAGLSTWEWLVFGMQLAFVAITMSSRADRISVMKSSLSGVVAGGWVASIEVLEEFRLGIDVKAHLPDNFMHPNGLGYEVGLACLCALFLWSLNRRLIWAISVAVLLGALFLSTSKGSLVSFFIIVVAFLFSSQSRLTTKWKLKLALILGCVSAISLIYVGSTFQAYQASDNADTLTGRVLVWGLVFEKILARPLIGYGFYSFSYNWPEGIWFQGSAHNELLQEWFTLGAIGVFILVLNYWSLLRSLWKSQSSFSRFGLYLLGFCLIRGIVEADDTHLQFALLFAGSLGISASQLRQKRIAAVHDSSVGPATHDAP